MTDRVGTEVLTNGARRYAVYDSSENFVEYLYLLLDDDPTTAGTSLNKATLLTDATAELLGLSSSDPTVNEAFAQLVATTSITLSASGWSSSAPYTQSVTVSGVTSSMSLLYALSPSVTSESVAEAYGYISTMETGSNTVTFTCISDCPTVAIPIVLRGI